MPKICIQAGHQNVKYNSIVGLRGSTGAPNEMEFNVDIRDKVSDELRLRGFTVQGTDANANDDPNIRSQDWDLFLSIHYDADIYGTGGGFADYPEPSTDGATTESQRICGKINDTYFKTTGIKLVNRSNENTRYFYMWKYLSSNTPCVILECGVGMHVPDDWQTLHFNRPLVVEGIVRSICNAFNVSYDIQEPVDPCEDIRKELEKKEKEYEEIKEKLDKKNADYISLNLQYESKVKEASDNKELANFYLSKIEVLEKQLGNVEKVGIITKLLKLLGLMK